MMRKYFKRIFVAISALAVTAATALAQPPAAQRELRPVLLTNGSIGEITSLVFSPDSRFLFVAGADKVIRTWSLVEARPNVFNPVLAQTMRWEISRGFQGRLETIAISPDGKLLAGGGVSARDSGDIGLWDTGTGRFAERPVLPIVGPDRIRIGHTENITSLDFSPNGKKLVTIDKSGAIWIWDVATGDRVPVQAGATVSYEFAPSVIFASDTMIASSVVNSRPQNERRQLTLFDQLLNTPDAPIRQRPTNPVQSLRTSALARHVKKPLCASGDESGAIRIWNAQNNFALLREIPPTRDRTAVQSVDFLGDELLIVARDRVQQPAKPSSVEVWNWETGQRIDQFEVGRYDICRSVRTSPDGRWIAYAFQDTDEVRLIRVPEGRLEKLSAPADHFKIIGRGTAIWEAQFVESDKDKSGLKVRFLDRRTEEGKAAADEYRGFDLNELRLITVGANNPVRTADADAGNWSKEISDIAGRRDEKVRLLFNNQALPQAAFETNERLQGRIRSYCWIAAPNEQQPFAIAIGTERQDGIYVYSLPAPGKPPRLLRYFRDHAGAVTSLSVSSDRQMLVSSSLDQTLKFWSLKELRPVDVGFRNRPVWGADFVIKNGALIVQNVSDYGIAARRGMKNGDQVTSLKWKEDKSNISRPEEMLKALESREIFEQVHVTWVPNGPPLGRPITPAWEPLATLFVDRHDEWILFTPDGVFDASAAEGPNLLGWQFNKGRGLDPDFFEAGELQKNLQKPGVLKGLLTGGILPPANLNVGADTVNRPVVKILSPKLTDPPANPNVPIQMIARVEYPPGVAPNNIQNDIYVNSQLVPGAASPLKPMDGRDPGWQTQTLTAKLQAPEALNSIQISSVTKVAAGDLQRKANVMVEAASKPPTDKFNLHIVSITCGAYPEGNFGVLKLAKSDGDAIVEAFRRRAGTYYNVDNVWRLDDSKQKVDRATVQRLFKDDVAPKLKDAAATDMLLVYLSGHGHVIEDQYRFIPSTPAFTAAEPESRWLTKTVGWSDINRDEIAKLACRKVFLIDTCRSGDLDESVKKLFHEGRMTSNVIVSAASRGQNAEEMMENKNSTGETLSVFTYYWVDGMKGDADGYSGRQKEDRKLPVRSDPDGVIQFYELTNYTEVKVPFFTEKRQRPCIFRRDRSFQMEFKLCPVQAN